MKQLLIASATLLLPCTGASAQDAQDSDAGDGHRARLRTELGVLTAPDYVVEIAVVGEAVSDANEVASA